MPDSKPKNKGGRPKKTIDYELVLKLASIQCTQEEIANILGLHRSTLLRDATFCDIYKKGIDEGKSSLRRLQWKAAENGSSAILIWLGKQYLGQQDKSVVENHNLNTEMPTIVVDDSVQDE
jgi:hypothetical protein